jgi:hypothetical protein
VNTPRRPDDELERLLADDGGELGALYRRLPRVEPPRRLDRSVLGEAARAVHGTRPRRQRWLVGFGSAAGLVLAAGVAWHVGHEPLRQAPHEPARSAPAYVPVKPIDPPARRHETATPADLAAPAPAASTPSRPAAANEAKAARAARPTLEQAAPAQRSAPPPPAPPPPPAAAPEPPAPAPVASPAVEAQQQAAAPAGASTTSAYSAGESEAPSGQAADAAPKKRERSTGMPAPSSSAELRRDTQLAPEIWLARIEQLVRQGRRQQAIESLQLFRRAHPDWQLPQSLRELDD